MTIEVLISQPFKNQQIIIENKFYLSGYKRCKRRLHISQAEINNRANVDPMLDTNFRLSTDGRNDNDVLRSYNTGFQRYTNTSTVG